jgi:hypothetical protein
MVNKDHIMTYLFATIKYDWIVSHTLVTLALIFSQFFLGLISLEVSLTMPKQYNTLALILK